MKNLWWQTFGEGNCHLVLLHGWSLNAQVWKCIGEQLAAHFMLHLVDLPGFGRSAGLGVMTLDEMSELVLQQAPDKAVWLGWSFGGLIASWIALTYPWRVRALVTVASSPCFRAQEAWPGIKPEVLSGFQRQLSEDIQRTVDRFLMLQTMRTDTARQDTRLLKSAARELPMLELSVLNSGLEMLKTVDLREPLSGLTQPHLRIYGALDGLVPREIVPLLDSRWSNSESLVVAKAAHAPFISHPEEFCQSLVDFSHRLISRNDLP